MKRGRKRGSSLFAKPERAEWDEIRNRIIYGSAEWPIVALRSFLAKHSKLPDNFLSLEQAKYERALAAHVRERQAIGRKYQHQPNKLWQALETMRHKLPLEQKDQNALPLVEAWRTLKTRFERAVLDGDAAWFERQANAIRKGGLLQRAQFNAKVVHLLELAMWGTHAKQVDNREDLTLTPAGKFTDAMASDIYNALDKQSESPLVVEGYQFENKERVMEAIHKLARQLKFALRKQH